MNYKLVSFPEIQAYMDHERWDECMLCISTDAEDTSSSDYAVPEDLYNEVNGIKNKQYILIASEGSYDDIGYRLILSSRDKELLEEKLKELNSQQNLDKIFIEKWRDQYDKDFNKVIEKMEDEEDDEEVLDYVEKHQEIISMTFEDFKKFSELEDDWYYPNDVYYHIVEVEEI